MSILYLCKPELADLMYLIFNYMAMKCEISNFIFIIISRLCILLYYQTDVLKISKNTYYYFFIAII